MVWPHCIKSLETIPLPRWVFSSSFFFFFFLSFSRKVRHFPKCFPDLSYSKIACGRQTQPRPGRKRLSHWTPQQLGALQAASSATFPFRELLLHGTALGVAILCSSHRHFMKEATVPCWERRETSGQQRLLEAPGLKPHCFAHSGSPVKPLPDEAPVCPVVQQEAKKVNTVVPGNNKDMGKQRKRKQKKKIL